MYAVIRIGETIKAELESIDLSKYKDIMFPF